MTTWKYVLLEADPDELRRAGPVDALVEQVAALYPVPVPLEELGADRCRVKVARGDEIAAIAAALGGGPCSGGGFLGAFLPPRLILAVRLDWRLLLAHELTHLCQYLTGRPHDEHEARWMEDVVG